MKIYLPVAPFLRLFSLNRSAAALSWSRGCVSMMVAVMVVTMGQTAQAQLINGTTYAFTNANGQALEDMSSGTTQLVAASSDDGNSLLTNIGFDFWFSGTRFTQFAANANGFIRLGVLPATSSWVNDIDNIAQAPKIAPFWDDLCVGSNGTVHYKVIGSAPDRKLIVEWLNMKITRNGACGGVGGGTFQMWIYESSHTVSPGVIEFVYGPGMVMSAAADGGYSVGLQSGLATNFASVTTITPSCSYVAANDSQMDAIASGTKYTFTPLVPSAPTGLSFTAVTAGGMTLNWTDVATNEVGYAIYRSDDGGTTYNFISQTAADAVLSVQSGLEPNFIYFWKVYAVTEGVLSSPASGMEETSSCGMSGTFSIGATGIYTTLAAALADLVSMGVTGPVVLEFQPDYVSEGEVTFVKIPCASSVNTITIRPAGGVGSPIEFTSAAAVPTFVINGGQYYIIDGRNGGSGTNQYISVTNSNTTGQAIQFINEASNNTFTFCDIRGVTISPTSGVVIFGTTTGPNGNDNNLIDRCSIRDGATTPANLIYATGTGTAETANSGNTISNNNIFNFFQAVSNDAAGVRIDAGNTDWTIDGNSFYQTASRTATGGTTSRGVYINTTTGNNFIVTNNFIGGTDVSSGGTPWTVGGSFASRFEGIRLVVGHTVPSSVYNNSIANFAWTSSSGASTLPGVWIGIYISSGSANIGTNSGNTIGSGTGIGSVSVTTSGSGAISYGIGSGAASAVLDISNNIIGSITTLGTTATISHSFAGIQVTSGTTVSINDNLIGSTSTTNSINASNASTSGTAQRVSGIENTSSAALSIIGNTIANLNNAYNGTASSLTMRGISSTSGVGTILGNTIRNLSSSSPGTGTTTSASTIGILYSAITAGNHTVSQNMIYSISNSAATASVHAYGIHYAGPSAGDNVVSRNLIHSLRLSSSSATATMMGISIGGGGTSYQNNMVRLGIDDSGASLTTANVIVGINKGTTTGNSFFHNSIYIGGTGVADAAVNTFAFRRTSTGTDEVRNNIFMNNRSNVSGAGKHYNIGLNTSTTAIVDNNVYYGNGMGFVQGYVSAPGATDYATLDLWQAGFGGDGASSFGDPQFVSPASGTPDLHIHPTNPSPAEGAGILVVSVPLDFDGQTRSGLTPVDIGADAGDFVSLDIASPVIMYTALTFTCDIGDRDLEGVTITDASGVPVSGTLQPRIYYKKGLGGSWFSSQGTLASGSGTNGTWDFTIIAADMGGLVPADEVYYYVIAQDIAPTPNIASSPGPGLMATDVNTVSTPPSSPNSYTINNSLSGTYLVGAGEVYTTLTAAITDYNISCLAGPVIFELVDPAYDANETFPIVIQANSYASNTNTLIIKPANGVTTSISGSSTSGLIVINGADYITIDGSNLNTVNSVCPPSAATRDLTITNTSVSTSSAVIWLQTATGSNGATNNIVQNCNIAGNSNTTTLFGIGSGSATISTSSLGTGNDNNSFINNNVSKTQYGIYSQGASIANKNNGTIINQNLINTASPDNVARGGIHVGFENNILISGNAVSGMSMGGSPDVFGIAVGMNAISVTGTAGNEVTNSMITKNIIGSIINTGTFSAAGITLAPATSGTNLIANNMIYGVAANGTSPDFCAGIILGGGTGSTTQVYYNTVSMQEAITGTTAATQTSACLAVTNSTAPTLDIRNNIFTNTQIGNTGASLRLVAIALGYSTFTTLISDYNDLYSVAAAPGTHHVGITGGVVAGTSRTTFMDWKTATEKDDNSINILPVFVSSSDLHIVSADPTNLPLNDGAVTVSVTDDIDCESRLTDIGADEFDSPSCITADGGTASVTGSSTFCGSGTPSIGASGYSVGTGSTYEWMSSSDAGDYPLSGTPVGGQNNPASLTTGVVNSTTHYWLHVICANGMTEDYSNMITITIVPLPTASLSPSGNVNICPPTSSQLLTSSTNASSPTFVWKVDNEVIDGETNATYSATMGGSYVVEITDGVTMCSQSSDPVNVSFHATPSAPEITPTEASLCVSDPAVPLTASIDGSGSGSVMFASGTISQAIPDVSSVGTSHTIMVSGVPGGATVEKVTITLNINHPWLEDVEVSLQGPNGEIINLAADQGGSGDNYVNTKITSDVTFPALSTGAPPFTGTFRADATAQINLIGAPAITTQIFADLFSTPNGDWTIRAYDDESLLSGTLVSWAIEIEYQNILSFVWTPNGPLSGLYTDAGATTEYNGEDSEVVYALPTSTTVYTVTAANAGGCTNSATVEVEITPSPTITLGTDPEECVGTLTTDLTYSGTTESPDEYSIDFDGDAELAGFMDVANAALPASPIMITIPGAAPAGVYNAVLTVHNSVSGCNGLGTPVTITILGSADAGIVSGASSLCINRTDTYMTTGDPGGMWSSTNPSVATVNPVTGLVTALSAGMTDITYEVDNGCGGPVSDFQTLTVDPALVVNTNASGPGSLSDVIDCVGPGTTVTFDASLMSQTILLTSAITIDKNLTLDGLGMLDLTISGGGLVNIFHVQSGVTFTIEDMSLKNGFSMTAGQGGAIYNEGTVFLENVCLQTNFEDILPQAWSGTGIYEIVGNVDVKN